MRTTERNSESFYQPKGLMQGECLSPTLISFFLNDLEERMNIIDDMEVLLISRKIALLKYADNLVLIACVVYRLAYWTLPLSIRDRIPVRARHF